MGPGGIATIIASFSLLIIATAIGYAVVRLSRFIDEAKLTLKTLTDETTPLIKESTRTVELVNGPLESINRITKNVENVTDKVAGAAEDFVSKGGPAVKALGLL
ncbi:MAG: DUF948 domain-containing protein, partial [Candidatus Nanopelagicaceae bacterium]